MTTFVVTTTADSGAGSLRAAIESANASGAGSATITFSVTGTITLTNDLPDVTKGVTIDATTSPGYTGGAPAVELDCNQHAGLTFAAGSDGSELLGMSIGNSAGNGVTLEAGSITLGSNYIGLASDGTALGNSGDGVFVASTSSDNTIGSNPTSASGVISNVISGNGGNGISLNGSDDNTLVDNYVGTDPTGTTAIANGLNGILVTGGAENNTIGGASSTENDPTGAEDTVPPVFVTPPLGNLVSGNTGDGIRIEDNSQNNVLSGNFVGTTADGNTALGNGADGVAIVDSNNNSLIGCTALDNPFVYYNVISGNADNGLRITDSDDTTVQANFFGIGANNSSIVANGNDGILVNGSSSNTQVGGVIPLGNVSAGNGNNGIEVADTASHFISFNTFGGLYAFQGAAPNGNDGILITSTGGHNTLQTNVLSGNTNNGIEIGGDASGVTVDPNIVGLTTDGATPLANGGDGLLIDGTAHDNTIGGDQQSVIPQNTFSGNVGYGVAITGAAHDNTVFNSNIGVDALGTAASANGAGGVLIGDSAANNTIGGTATGDADIISGNDGNGVTLEDNTTATSIIGNIIGRGVLGIVPLPNSGVPIETNDSTDNVIVGNETFACFATGTHIATSDGDIAVETLKVGDLVRTVDGSDQPISWIGHRHIDFRQHPEPAKVLPVCIQAHAFGLNEPIRDLFLSPDHAVFTQGVLIPVKHLINDTTIRQVDRASLTYFHIELPRHAVMLAEGLAVESYLDTGDRTSFANNDGAVALHPSFGIERGDVLMIFEALGYAPLCVTGPSLQTARSLVAAQAALSASMSQSTMAG